MNKCNYCDGKHSCRECPDELKVAPYMNKIIGLHMEQFVANRLNCPRCGCNNLILLGNYAPSLDIECGDCNGKFEVKSKCLSVNNIPKDLILNHGNYFEYIKRQKEELNFIFIIYGVDRNTKTIYIRKVLYASNEIINNKKYITIEQKANSTLSDIRILDNTKLEEIKLKYKFSYDFSDSVKYILSSISK